MTEHTTYHNNATSVFSGLIVGLLAGAATALLLAPRSGEETRNQIQQKSIELRDQTTYMVKDGMSQMRSRMKEITTDGAKKIKELQNHGKEITFKQLDRVSEIVKEG
jgi:gas vesicle protein